MRRSFKSSPSRRKALLLALSVLLAVWTGCADESKPALDRETILRWLVQAQLPDPDRILAHYSHTCDLTIGGASHPVVDLREWVRNAQVPRGLNRIIVFRPDGQVFQQLEYIDHRPLFCRGSELFVFGELEVALTSGPTRGNVLVFSEDPEAYELRSEPEVSLPTLREQQGSEPATTPDR